MGDYTDLQASLLDVLDDPALTNADAQKFIGLAEPKLERDMLSPTYGSGAPAPMLARITDTTDSGNAITLPADYFAPRSVVVASWRARYAAPELVSSDSTGFANAAVTLDYYQRLPVLSATNLSSWLLDRGYDCYMWAAALQYAAWGQDMDTVTVWETYYSDAVRTIRNAYRPQPRGSMYRHPSKQYGAFYTVIGQQMLFGSPKV